MIDRFDDPDAKKIQDLAGALAERLGRIEIENSNMCTRLKELGEWDALIEDGSVHEHLVGTPIPDDVLGRVQELLNHKDAPAMPPFYKLMADIYRHFTRYHGIDIFKDDWRARWIYGRLSVYFKHLGIYHLQVTAKEMNEYNQSVFNHIKRCALQFTSSPPQCDLDKVDDYPGWHSMMEEEEPSVPCKEDGTTPVDE